MPPKIITTTNLGKTLKVGASAIDVNVDGTSITADPATGVLSAGVSKKNVRVVTSNTTLDGSTEVVVCNNSSSNITLTLPSASTCEGAEKTITRYVGSTGAISVNGGSIQALNGSLGVTTLIPSFNTFPSWVTTFKAVKVGSVFSWLKIS